MGQQMRQGGQNGGGMDFNGYGQQGPQFQQNPWDSPSKGGMPGSMNSMYPNQQQFAPKPMMSGTGGAGLVGQPPQNMAPPQQFMQQPGRAFAGGPGGFNPGGPGGFRSPMAPVDPAVDPAMFRTRY
jgi:hypothetical protein